MSQSESVAKLTTALAIAQNEFETITKNKIGQEGNQKFPYSTLSAVLEAIRPALNKQGIFLSQPVIIDPNGSQRVTTKVQLGDEFIQTDGILLSAGLVGSKKLGLEITYSKRYDLTSFMGVCAEDDDKDAPDLKPGAPPTYGYKPVVPQHVQQSAQKQVQKLETLQKPVQVVDKPIINPNIPLSDIDFGVDKPVGESFLSPDAKETADHLIHFVPLSEKRNTEIQDKLKSLVGNKTLDRRKLSIFLEERHGQKKAFEVSATQWEETIKLIDNAVAEGEAAIKLLLKPAPKEKDETN